MAAELLAPVAVQVVGQRRVVLPVVYLISVFIQIIIVLPQRFAVDDAAEAPEPAELIGRNAVRDQMQVEAVGRFAPAVDDDNLVLRIPVDHAAVEIIPDPAHLLRGMYLMLGVERECRVIARRGEVGVDERRELRGRDPGVEFFAFLLRLEPRLLRPAGLRIRAARHRVHDLLADPPGKLPALVSLYHSSSCLGLFPEARNDALFTFRQLPDVRGGFLGGGFLSGGFLGGSFLGGSFLGGSSV